MRSFARACKARMMCALWVPLQLQQHLCITGRLGATAGCRSREVDVGHSWQCRLQEMNLISSMAVKQ